METRKIIDMPSEYSQALNREVNYYVIETTKADGTKYETKEVAGAVFLRAKNDPEIKKMVDDWNVVFKKRKLMEKKKANSKDDSNKRAKTNDVEKRASNASEPSKPGKAAVVEKRRSDDIGNTTKKISSVDETRNQEQTNTTTNTQTTSASIVEPSPNTIRKVRKINKYKPTPTRSTNQNGVNTQETQQPTTTTPPTQSTTEQQEQPATTTATTQEEEPMPQTPPAIQPRNLRILEDFDPTEFKLPEDEPTQESVATLGSQQSTDSSQGSAVPSFLVPNVINMEGYQRPPPPQQQALDGPSTTPQYREHQNVGWTHNSIIPPPIPAPINSPNAGLDITSIMPELGHGFHNSYTHNNSMRKPESLDEFNDILDFGFQSNGDMDGSSHVTFMNVTEEKIAADDNTMNELRAQINHLQNELELSRNNAEAKKKQRDVAMNQIQILNDRIQNANAAYKEEIGNLMDHIKKIHDHKELYKKRNDYLLNHAGPAAKVCQMLSTSLTPEFIDGLNKTRDALGIVTGALKSLVSAASTIDRAQNPAYDDRSLFNGISDVSDKLPPMPNDPIIPTVSASNTNIQHSQ